MASALEVWLTAMLTGGNAPAATFTDPTTISVSNPTGTGQALTKAWTMLPGTPLAGTVYTITCELTGTWEANAMAIGVLINGTWTAFTPSVGASSWSASTVIAGWLKLTARVLSATSARVSIYGALGETASSVTPASGTVNVTPVSQAMTIAASDTVALAFLFGASNSGQGLASYGSSWTVAGGQG